MESIIEILIIAAIALGGFVIRRFFSSVGKEQKRSQDDSGGEKKVFEDDAINELKDIFQRYQTEEDENVWEAQAESKSEEIVSQNAAVEEEDEPGSLQARYEERERESAKKMEAAERRLKEVNKMKGDIDAYATQSSFRSRKIDLSFSKEEVRKGFVYSLIFDRKKRGGISRARL